MKMDFRELMSRVAAAGPFFVLGVLVFWRAYNGVDPMDPSITAPVLCIILGIILLITGIMLAMRSGDLEHETALEEQSPAQEIDSVVG